MRNFDQKINQYFEGLVVRKDLVKEVKGNVIVPSYVLEYLLGQYCATHDEASIQTGIETVKEILRRHYVHRNEAGLIRSNIKEKGRYKIIDKISVTLNDKADVYEASFANLGIKKVLVDSSTVKAHPKLLVSGVWSIADIEYEFVEDNKAFPWLLASLKPIQLSHFNFDSYLEARQQFSTDEWMDLLIQSIGFNPDFLSRRSKLTQLIRLIPFCERNYNLIELGPKGTGKSHIYSEFSPHGILISGGEVTVSKLFVNNATGKIGLVGYWDVVAFDEFAGKQKRVDKALVDIMKNYMANKSFSRGIETLGAESSLVFVGNTQHTVPYMLKHSNLFADLPQKFYDSAFLDRIHFYIPGWEMDIIRGEMFSSSYGFVVDYLAEILRYLRNHDYSDRYQPYFSLASDISVRDRDGINKTFSGLMKLLFPSGEATLEEIEDILKFAIEGRKRVKDQLIRMDNTYPSVCFAYLTQSRNSHFVTTLEEQEYPQYYNKTNSTENTDPTITSVLDINSSDNLKEQTITIQENQKGITFDRLFGPYIQNVNQLTVIEPHLRNLHEIDNFLEFLETIIKFKSTDEEMLVHLITTEDEFQGELQQESFSNLTQSCLSMGIHLSWEFDSTKTAKDGQIVTAEGWQITLSQGLNIFQQRDTNNPLSFANRLQQLRFCRACQITYFRCFRLKY